jgi:hypothetical protein
VLVPLFGDLILNPAVKVMPLRREPLTALDGQQECAPLPQVIFTLIFAPPLRTPDVELILIFSWRFHSRDFGFSVWDCVAVPVIKPTTFLPRITVNVNGSGGVPRGTGVPGGCLTRRDLAAEDGLHAVLGHNRRCGRVGRGAGRGRCAPRPVTSSAPNTANTDVLRSLLPTEKLLSFRM